MDNADSLGLSRSGEGEAKSRGRTVDLLEEQRDMVIVEGETTAEHDVENHSATPDVYFRAGVQPGVPKSVLTRSRVGDGTKHALSRDDLGGGVVGTPARGFEEISIAHDVGKTEIGDLDVEVLVEEQAGRWMHEVSPSSRRSPFPAGVPHAPKTHFSGLRSRCTMLCEWQ